VPYRDTRRIVVRVVTAGMVSLCCAQASLERYRQAPTTISDGGRALSEARRKWEAQRPNVYSYRLTGTCYCRPRVWSTTIRVVGDSVVSVQDCTADGKSTECASTERSLTISQLLDDMEAVGPTRVTYDSVFGYPAWWEVGTVANDSGVLWEISDMTVIRQ
jgi:hypothetical protein